MGPQLETRSQRSAIPRWSGCLDTEPLRQGKVTLGAAPLPVGGPRTRSAERLIHRPGGHDTESSVSTRAFGPSPIHANFDGP